MRIFFLTMCMLGILGACSSMRNTTTVSSSVAGTVEVVEEPVSSPASDESSSEASAPDITPSSTRSMRDQPKTSAAERSLIDPAIPSAIAGQPEWQFQREAAADFDGDGVAERAVLIAKVQVSDGRPVWDDSQPWQVYIEEADTTRTYVYARNVQLGNVETLLTQADPQQAAAIVLVERTPQNLGIYEIRYRGPNDTEAIEVLQRPLDPANGFTGTAY